MTTATEPPSRRRGRRLAAYATAVGLGAGIVSGTGVASADIETDPTDPPSNGTNALGPTVDKVAGVVTNAVSGLPLSPQLERTVNQTVINVGRIATNHSLTTARLV